MLAIAARLDDPLDCIILEFGSWMWMIQVKNEERKENHKKHVISKYSLCVPWQ